MTQRDPREDAWESYKLAVEEYRFQTNLNWSRSQYWFVLAAALLVAGTSLAAASPRVPDAVPLVTFGAGALVSVLAWLATNTQHGYYRNARDTKARLEEELQLGKFALTTTPSMGAQAGEARWWRKSKTGRAVTRTADRVGRVQTFQKVMLAALAIGNAVGVVAVLDGRHDPTLAPSVVGVLPSSSFADAFVVVASDGDRVEQRAEVADDGSFRLSLAEGRHRLSVASADGKVCTASVAVTEDPVQLAPPLTCSEPALSPSPKKP